MVSPIKEPRLNKALSNLTRQMNTLKWPLVGVVTLLFLVIPLAEAKLSQALICLSFLCMLVAGACFLACIRAVEKMKHEMNLLHEALQEEKNQKNQIQKMHDDLLDNQLALDLATRTKAEFLANMTHELRTPLNGIFGVVEVLSRTKLTADQSELLDTIRDCDNVLLALVNGILDFSKIEAQQLVLESQPFDIRKSVENATRMLHLKAVKQGIQITFTMSQEVPAVVYGDLTRFEQILLNLLSNALKFTERGTISISVELDPKYKRECVLRLTVQDTGCGIPAAQIPKLFRKFSQVDASTTRRYGGTGLGLAICKGLAELMGGTIWVESEEGKGSRFIVLLKVVPAPGETPINRLAGGATKEPTSHYPISILIVDDNQVNRTIAARLLDMLGYRADVACDGTEALEATKSKHYDLIFMDLAMPNMDGIEATRQIRLQSTTDKSPYIVALTANAIKQEQERCFTSGMNDYLTKPVSLEQLTGAIHTCATKANAAPISAPLKLLTRLPEDEHLLINEKILHELRSMSRPGEGDFLSLLIGQYLSDSSGSIVSLKDAWARRDLIAVGKWAHKIRGAAKNMGAIRVSELAAQIESKVDGSMSEGLGALVTELEKAYEDSNQILLTWQREAA